MFSLIRGGEKLRIDTFLDRELVHELTVGGSTRENCNLTVTRDLHMKGSREHHGTTNKASINIYAA
jgi:hypothetical protein